MARAAMLEMPKPFENKGNTLRSCFSRHFYSIPTLVLVLFFRERSKELVYSFISLELIMYTLTVQKLTVGTSPTWFKMLGTVLCACTLYLGLLGVWDERGSPIIVSSVLHLVIVVLNALEQVLSEDVIDGSAFLSAVMTGVLVFILFFSAHRSKFEDSQVFLVLVTMLLDVFVTLCFWLLNAGVAGSRNGKELWRVLAVCIGLFIIMCLLYVLCWRQSFVENVVLEVEAMVADGRNEETGSSGRHTSAPEDTVGVENTGVVSSGGSNTSPRPAEPLEDSASTDGTDTERAESDDFQATNMHSLSSMTLYTEENYREAERMNIRRNTTSGDLEIADSDGNVVIKIAKRDVRCGTMQYMRKKVKQLLEDYRSGFNLLDAVEDHSSQGTAVAYDGRQEVLDALIKGMKGTRHREGHVDIVLKHVPGSIKPTFLFVNSREKKTNFDKKDSYLAPLKEAHRLCSGDCSVLDKLELSKEGLRSENERMLGKLMNKRVKLDRGVEATLRTDESGLLLEYGDNAYSYLPSRANNPKALYLYLRGLLSLNDNA